MTAKPDQDQELTRKSNKRLALILGVIAIVFYLVVVVFKPMAGS